MPGAVDEEEKARALREIESYGKEEQVRDRAAGGERGGRRERDGSGRALATCAQERLLKMSEAERRAALESKVADRGLKYLRDLLRHSSCYSSSHPTPHIVRRM